MKRFFIPLLAAVIWFTGTAVLHAGSRITAILTITNAPETGDTLSSGSSIRTWTNVTAAAFIQTNSLGGWTNLNGSATNLFSHLAATPLPGPLIVQWSDTNAVKLIGQLDQSFSLLATGEWASVTYTTQSYTKSWTVLWPIDAIPAQTNRTNQASDIIYGSRYSTYAFTATDSAVSNLVGLGNNQVIGGMKSWTGTNRFYGPVYLTNGTVDSLSVSNGFTSVGLGNASTVIGTDCHADNEGGIAIGYGVEASGEFAIGIGQGDNTAAKNSIAIGNNAEAGGSNSISVGTGALANATDTIAIGAGATVYHSNSIAIGVNAATTASNEIMIGASGQTVRLGGYVSAATLTNSYMRGTNRIEDMSLTPQDITTLADGANSVALLGTNSALIRFIGTITANASLNGVSGGRDGRVLIIENDTGYSLTLAHSSGLEPTAANRMLSPNSSDVILTDNGHAMLIYDGGISRWKIANAFPTTLAATNYAIGEMMIYDVTNRYVLAADTWLTITNWTSTGLTTNVTASTNLGTLTVQQAGIYNIRGHASFSGVDVGGDNYELGLFRGDGTVSMHTEAYSAATSTDRHNATCFGYASLTNGEIVTLRINSEVGDDVDILGAQLNIQLVRP